MANTEIYFTFTLKLWLLQLSRIGLNCWHWPVGKTGELDLEVCCPVVGQYGCSWALPTNRNCWTVTSVRREEENNQCKEYCWSRAYFFLYVIITRALFQECITGWVEEQDQAKDVVRRSRQRLVSRERGPLKMRELESRTHRRSRGLWAGSPSGKSLHILCMLLLLLTCIHNLAHVLPNKGLLCQKFLRLKTWQPDTPLPK